MRSALATTIAVAWIACGRPAHAAEWMADGDGAATIRASGAQAVRVTCATPGKATVTVTFPGTAGDVTLSRRGTEGNAAAGIPLAARGPEPDTLHGTGSARALLGFLTDRSDAPAYALVSGGVRTPLDLGNATGPVERVLGACGKAG